MSERSFSKEILDAAQAIRVSGRFWEHCFDNVGTGLEQGAQRPADRLIVYRGRPFLLELKQVTGNTLAHSKLQPNQVRALLRCSSAGGFGLVLVRRFGVGGRAGKAWWFGTELLLAHGADSRGNFPRGSFNLLEQAELTRIDDPRGYAGRVWALAPLFNLLIERSS